MSFNSPEQNSKKKTIEKKDPRSSTECICLRLIQQNKKRDASPNTPLDSNKQTKLLEPILFIHVILHRDQL